MASQWTTAARHDRMAEIREQLNDMNREAGGDQFDQESRDTWNTLNAELDEHRAALDELRVREERLAEAAADPNPDRSESGHDSGVRATATTVGGREAARSAGLRAIDRYRDVLPTDAGDRLDHHVREQDVLGHDARYLAAVAEPAYESAFIKMLRDPSTGHLRFSPREVEAVRAVTKADEERAMAVGTGGTGGFGAPFQLDPSIMNSGTGSINAFRQISRVETVTGYEWRGVTADQVTAHYRVEATEVQDDSPTLVQPVVHPMRGDAIVPISIEVEQDYPTLVNELGTLLSDARDNLDATMMVSGVPGSNQPTGVLSIGQTGSLTTTQRVLSAATGSLALADVWSLKAQVQPRFIENGSIIANTAILDTTYRFVGGGSTEPPLMPTRDGPVVGLRQASSSAMATTTTSNSRVMVAGDFKAGYLIGDRLGFSVELVPHLFGASSRFPTGQRGVLAIWRTGAAVVVPNALRYLEIK